MAITSRREALLEEAAAEIRTASGSEPVVITGDLYDADTPERLAAAARERLGRIDILINAAGGSRPTTFDAPAALWEEAMTLNFFRLRALTHAVVPGMVEHRWGRVINLTGSPSRTTSTRRIRRKPRSMRGAKDCRVRSRKAASP